MINIIINNTTVTVKKGSTIFNACQKAGAHVPTFCYHEKLIIAGNCRICLVEVKNSPKLLVACSTPAIENIVIYTNQ